MVPPARPHGSPAPRRAAFALVAACILLAVVPLLAAWDEVGEHLARARYESAREASRALALEEPAVGDARIWPILLEPDPERALAELRELAGDERLSEPLRIRVALETASIELARARPAEALAPLERLMGEARGHLPGEVYLLAGMAQRGLRRQQRSREAFASVRQDDAAFPWARLYLGQIALEEGDLALAHRYLDSADRSTLAGRLPDLVSARCEALRREGRADEAAALREDLTARFPQSLAAAALEGAEGPAAPGPSPEEDAVPTPETAPRGRLCLQLAAFSDRGRALAYLDRWRSALPELRLETEPGGDGQILYKVRSGRFVSRAQARTEAERVRRVHGLEAIVVESAGAP